MLAGVGEQNPKTLSRQEWFSDAKNTGAMFLNGVEEQS